VGCGRCGRSCLAGIKPPEIIRDLQQAERSHETRDPSL
jgi:Fe-S oxidoreductase